MRNTPFIAPLVGHTVAEVERELIIHTLSHHCGSRTKAARILGLSIRTLRNKIREYAASGIEVPTPRRAEWRTIMDGTEISLPRRPAAKRLVTPTFWFSNR